ncbi:MAG TPA: c-type cytochrome [Geminicoccaceae bacterium]
MRRGASAPRPQCLRRAAAFALVAVWSLPTLALAQAPDLDAGRGVVVGGEDASITPCFVCHGLDGVGDSAGAFPRLTGQAAFYMYKQLIDYASEARPHDVMTPIAREMTEPQMADVAFYYSVLDAPHARRPAVEPAVLARGRQIAEDGLPEAGVQACNLCHGAGGAGNPPLFPYLAGQYAPYTELQMQLFKRGARANDALGVMRDIAEDLRDEDIRAVALYFEWLRPAEDDKQAGARVGARERERTGG